MNSIKIVFDYLTKRFKNRKKSLPNIVAVDDFCIEISDGKLIGLFGPLGCDKSTWLKKDWL